MTVTLVYGTESGTTEKIARWIATPLSARLVSVDRATPADFEGCDLLVLGAPTYGFGDLSADWEKGIAHLREANLNGRTVALFGTGDQVSYADSFVDAMGTLYDEVTARGARVVGATPTEGYDFVASRAVREGQFVGLALDQDNQAKQTESRIARWLEGLR